MDDSGAILCQISYLKDMLDQVNEEIEANIQTTREIESEIVKCAEYESALSTRESELTKMKCLAEFEMDGFVQVAGVARTSVGVLEKELNCLRTTREEAVKRISDKREAFILLCEGFQRDIIRGGNEELSTLLSEKEVLENETYNLIMKDNALRNSMSAFAEEIIEELRTSNSEPERMVLCLLPVLPPELRPIIQLDGGKLMSSDINELYRRVIFRNISLIRLLKEYLPGDAIMSQKKLVQEAVDTLLDNGLHGQPMKDRHNKVYKSFSNVIEGKGGRFRETLLGKQVDYSGREFA